MKFLNILQKKPPPAPVVEPFDHNIEEYEVATYARVKIPMTGEMIRRQREEEIRKKYCSSTIKTGKVL